MLAVTTDKLLPSSWSLHGEGVHVCPKDDGAKLLEPSQHFGRRKLFRTSCLPQSIIKKIYTHYQANWLSWLKWQHSVLEMSAEMLAILTGFLVVAFNLSALSVDVQLPTDAVGTFGIFRGIRNSIRVARCIQKSRLMSQLHHNGASSAAAWPHRRLC